MSSASLEFVEEVILDTFQRFFQSIVPVHDDKAHVVFNRVVFYHFLSRIPPSYFANPLYNMVRIYTVRMCSYHYDLTLESESVVKPSANGISLAFVNFIEKKVESLWNSWVEEVQFGLEKPTQSSDLSDGQGSETDESSE
jgi:hypothetical protein